MGARAGTALMYAVFLALVPCAAALAREEEEIGLRMPRAEFEVTPDGAVADPSDWTHDARELHVTADGHAEYTINEKGDMPPLLAPSPLGQSLSEMTSLSELGGPCASFKKRKALGTCVPALEVDWNFKKKSSDSKLSPKCMIGKILANPKDQMAGSLACQVSGVSTDKTVLADTLVCCANDDDTRIEKWRGAETEIMKPDYDGNTAGDTVQHGYDAVACMVLTMPLPNGEPTHAQMSAMDCHPHEGPTMPEACVAFDGLGFVTRGMTDTATPLVMARAAVSRVVGVSFTTQPSIGVQTVGWNPEWEKNTFQIGRNGGLTAMQPADGPELHSNIFHTARWAMAVAMMGEGRTIKYTAPIFNIQVDTDMGDNQKYQDHTAWFEFLIDKHVPAEHTADPTSVGRWVLMVKKGSKNPKPVNLRDAEFKPTADPTRNAFSLAQSKVVVLGWKAMADDPAWKKHAKLFKGSDYMAEEQMYFIVISPTMREVFKAAMSQILQKESDRFKAGQGGDYDSARTAHQEAEANMVGTRLQMQAAQEDKTAIEHRTTVQELQAADPSGVVDAAYAVEVEALMKKNSDKMEALTAKHTKDRDGKIAKRTKAIEKSVKAATAKLEKAEKKAKLAKDKELKKLYDEAVKAFYPKVYAIL